MAPDRIFEMKPRNNCVDFKLSVSGDDSVWEALNLTLNMSQVKELSDMIVAAMKEAEKIHQIVENADCAKPMKVTF